jgi:hypothetical protein
MTHDGWSAGIFAAAFPQSQRLQLLLVIFAGWVNRHKLDVIEYLQEENRVLKEHLGGRRIPLPILSAADSPGERTHLRAGS